MKDYRFREKIKNRYYQISCIIIMFLMVLSNFPVSTVNALQNDTLNANVNNQFDLHKEVESEDEDKFEISTNFDKNDEDYGLSIIEVTEEYLNYETYRNRTLELIGADDAVMKLYSISIVANNNKVIPEDDVLFSINKIQNNTDQIYEDTEVILLHNRDRIIQENDFSVNFSESDDNPIIVLVNQRKSNQQEEENVKTEAVEEVNYSITAVFAEETDNLHNELIEVEIIDEDNEKFDEYINNNFVVGGLFVDYLSLFELKINSEEEINDQELKEVDINIDIQFNNENDCNPDELMIVRFDSNGNTLLKPDVKKDGNSINVKFDLESASVFGLVEAKREVTLTHQGENYLIKAVYNGDSGIPADAKLRVYEIVEEDDKYEDYVNKTSEALGEEPEKIKVVKAFDISLINQETGYEYQPNNDVKISIEFLNENLNDSENVEVVHIDEEDAEVLNSSTNGETVEFKTDGFSIFVCVVVETTIAPIRTYVFYYIDEDGNYKEYPFIAEDGNEYFTQDVKNGERPVIPQLTSTDTMVFAGWYEGNYEGSELIISEEPFDFDKKITENDQFNLYAVYKNYVYAVFYDQYDSSTSKWPVAYTRRAELDDQGNAVVKISDLSVNFRSSDNINMDFCGWSLKPISVPGSNYDDEGSTVVKVATDEKGCITIREDTKLYPIFKPIHWLTFYTSYSGSGAEYIPPASYYTDVAIKTPLPVTSRDGFVFVGWYTGNLAYVGDEEIVNYGEQVTNDDGTLVDSIDDGAFVKYNEELHMRYDGTLYAMWEANYRIVIWKQTETDEPDSVNKNYEYAESFNLGPVLIGSEVSVDEQYKHLAYENYHFSHCDSKTTVGNKEVTVLNVYYDLHNPHEPSGNAHIVKFVDSNDESIIYKQEELNFGDDIKAPEDPVSDILSPSNKAIYAFSGWFMDKNCTIVANVDDMLMPDHELVFYAGWESEWYIVSIDTNYGALYAYNDDGVLEGSGAAWFWSSYDSEPIGEYTHTTRDYVESNEGTYYFVKHDLDYYDNSPPNGADRKTYYTEDLNEATEFESFEYVPGAYSYAGWYEVFEDGSEASEPYDFNQHVDHYTTLRLHWKKNGNFYIAYSAGDGELDDEQRSKELLVDSVYSDNANVVLVRSAIAPEGYTFIGWKIRGSDNNSLYATGGTFTLNGDDAIRTGGKEIVYLDAVYSKVGLAKIVYDANGGTISSDADFGSIYDGSELVAVVDGSTATVSNLKNNAKIMLSSGNGFTKEGAKFLGWSTKAIYEPGDADAKFYSKTDITSGNVIYGVDKNEPSTLYAVWGVEVAYFKNNGNASMGTWDPEIYEYDQSTDSYKQTVYINTAVEEPVYIPNSNADIELFGYWATKDEEGNFNRYDFSQPVTEKTELYAYWVGLQPLEVDVVDASGSTLVKIDKEHTTDWIINDIQLGKTEVSLADVTTIDSIVTKPNNYEFAFAAVTTNYRSISEDKIVTSAKYDENTKNIFVKFNGSDDYVPLNGEKLYFVYFKDRELDIRYQKKDINSSIDVNVKEAAPRKTGNISSTSYSVAGLITAPLNWQADSEASAPYYAYAIGDNSQGLKLITKNSDDDDNRPTLFIRNTWRGFEYSTSGSDWSSCGYDPVLFVLYFDRQPNYIKINEKTIGIDDVINSKTFNYTVTIHNNVEGDGDDQTIEFSLKSGDSRTIMAYYWEETVDEETIRHTQSVTVTQSEDGDYNTVNSCSTGSSISDYVWEYETTMPDQQYVEPAVSFVNTKIAQTVTVNVALVTEDNIILRNGLIDHTSENVNIFELSLDESASIIQKLPYENIYAGGKNPDYAGEAVYTFGTIMLGSSGDTEGNTVDVKNLDVSTVTYSRVSEDRYALVLKDSQGRTIGELGSDKIFYLYYPMPKVKYVKLESNELNTIKGSINGVDLVDTITYYRGSITMNGVTVEQNQSIEIPLDGLLISQNGGSDSFRMPPTLDDGVYERYLSYSKIGVGGNIASSINDLNGVSEELILRLRINENKLQYSFDDENWSDLELRNTPTVYAIYTERGYDLLINKTVNTDSSGKDPLFTEHTFTVTLTSMSITKSRYDVEGDNTTTIPATPAEGSNPGVIVLEVEDGSMTKIKQLGRGDYTIVETNKVNYTLSARVGRIIGGTSEPVVVTDDSTVLLTLDNDVKLELINSPKPLCRIVDSNVEHIFYTLNSAISYVENEIASNTATIEMLRDYTVPLADAPIIQNGCSITFATANSYSGDSMAVLSRGEDLLNTPLFINNGSLCLSGIELNGSTNEPISVSIVQSAGNLIIDSETVITGANNNRNGGAINATSGDITINSSTINGNKAASGGAIYYSGGGTITISETAKILSNIAESGNGGAIYLTNGSVVLGDTSQLSNNKAENGFGGAIYADNALITIKENSAIKNNIAKSGGALYVNTGTINIEKTENVSPPWVNNNTATTTNGGAINIGTGNVNISGGILDYNKAKNGFGGAICSESAHVTISGSAEIKKNDSQNGGALRTYSGTVRIEGGSIAENSTDNSGGAVYTESGSISVSGGDISDNTADSNGGAFFTKDGNVTVSGGDISDNTADSNGGALYLENGNVSVSCDTMNGNKATGGSGGAIYAKVGSVNISDTTLSENSAGSNGGAIYAKTGHVSLTNSIFASNSSGASGGALYAESGNIVISSGRMKNNSASENGGAIYAGNGLSSSVDYMSLTGNVASGNGGAIYVDSGNFATTGIAIIDTDDGANRAANGSAIFVNKASLTLTDGNIKNNIATEGGAIGIGNESAQLHFIGNIIISDNRTNGNICNVYLNQDTESIIYADGLGSNAIVGIFVPGDFDSELFKHRGAASAEFGSYTNDSNVIKFKNDRISSLKALVGNNNKVIWGKEIVVEVRYVASFTTGNFPPNITYEYIGTKNPYYPSSVDNSVSNIASELYNSDYKTHSKMKTAAFACAFADGASSFEEYLTDVNWNSESETWEFIRRDGTKIINKTKIILYYSEPAYLSIVNNTDIDLDLDITKLEVLGIDDAAEGCYGYVTARNGATTLSLLPINKDTDLKLEHGQSIKFLFPGACNKTVGFNGVFSGDNVPEGYKVKYKINDVDQSPDLDLTFEINPSLLATGKTTEIIFGDELPICKIGDETFKTLNAALQYITANIDNKTATIEMLVDYLVPASDVLNIPDGYHITLTTASKDSTIPYSGEGTRATLSRGSDVQGAFVIADRGTLNSDKTCKTSLHIDNIFFDGRSLAGNGDGGAVKTKNANVLIENSVFKGFEATNGGAIYIDFAKEVTSPEQSKLEVLNTQFLTCRSSSSTDKTGGGAIWTTARNLYIEGCLFDACACYKNLAQGGAIFHNIKKDWAAGSISTFKECVFRNCYVEGAAAGAVESDALSVNVIDSSFDTCYSKKKNGGAFNVWANDDENPTIDCSVTISGSSFYNCSNPTNGGAVRCTSRDVKVENSSFISCTTGETGGAISMTNSNARKMELYGVTIKDCTSASNSKGTGGGIYTKAVEVIVDGYTYTDEEGNEITNPTQIINCSSLNSGGGICHDNNNASASLRINNAVITGNTSTASNGGGIYTKSKKTTINSTNLSNNSAKKGGGGIYDYPGSGNPLILTITGSTISKNVSNSDGGAIYFDSSDANSRKNMSLTIEDSEMDGNISGSNGGGIYTLGKIVEISGSTINNCVAAKEGGGLFHNRGIADSKLTISESEFDSCKANGGNGGAIYSNVRKVEVVSSTINNNTSSGNGGGLYVDESNNRAYMSFTIQGCILNGNTAGSSGGGVYTGVNTLIIEDKEGISTKISNCSAAINGGGIYNGNNNSSATTSIVNCTIEDNSADGTATSINSGGGGGIYSSSGTMSITGSIIRNNVSAGNGGGIYYNYARNNNIGSLTIDDSSIIGNTSGNYGGGICTRSYLYMKNDSMVTDNKLSTNERDKAAGIYMADNMTFHVGSSGAEKADKSSVKNNYIVSGESSNLRLWSNTNGENNENSVYVYCDLNGDIRVVNANKVGTWFGSSFISDPDGFADDYPVFRADSSTLHGIISRTDESKTKIIWAGPPIAKITDGKNILYFKSVTFEGVKRGMDPAIFDRLDTGNGGSYSTMSAFDMLKSTETPVLFTADGELYQGNTYYIMMLVEFYETNDDITVKSIADRNIVFTTASKTDSDYPYEGSGTRATVIRGSGVSTNRTLFNVFGNLKFENIIIDGGSENNITLGSSTRCVWVEGNDYKVVLGNNATLQNGHVTGESNGGGVYVKKGTFEIRGGAIRNCVANNGGGVYMGEATALVFEAGSIYQCTARGNGGGIHLNSGTLDMIGGTISNGSAAQGGGVFVANNRKMYMSGGSIVNNTVTVKGGGIAIGGSSSKLYFSKRPTVTGNKLNDAVCNVELDQDTNGVINTNNSGLYPGSYIGVYVHDGVDLYDKHGQEKQPFGTFATGDNIANLYCFVNDRNGLKGGIIENPDPNTIYWIEIFGIKISKNIETSASIAIDPDEEFSFTVNLRGNGSQGQPGAAQIDGQYGEMYFHSNGVDTTTATFTLKPGESITGVNLTQGLYYEVIESLTPEQKQKYAAVPSAVQTGEIGENRGKTGIDPYTSDVNYINLLPVCKIVDNNGNLLYRKYADNIFIPAVYTELTGENEAFDAVNGSLYQKNGSHYSKYLTSQGCQIQMLVTVYQITEDATISHNKLTLATASKTVEDFPYRGTGSVAQIQRMQNADNNFTKSVFTLNSGAGFTLENIVINGNKANCTALANGGLVNVKSNSTLYIKNGAVLRNSNTGTYTGEEETIVYKGGAVFVAKNGKVVMSGGTIKENSSDGNGAGVYLSSGSRLELSGTLTFGNSTRPGGAIDYKEGNFKNGSLTAKTNGGQSYTKARQDIYLEEKNEDNPVSIIVGSSLDGPDGSIWVWAENACHYETLMPFARKESNNVTNPAVFRNAQDDETNKNETGTYLYGSVYGDNGNLLYWSGNYGFKQVILRKINASYTSLSSAKFTIYRGNSEVPYQITKADGTIEILRDRESDVNGIIWVGTLPYGIYYLLETQSPKGYDNNKNKWYCLILDDTGEYIATQASDNKEYAYYRTMLLKDAS